MALPKLIPGFDVPLVNENGIINQQWYLFFYNLGNQTFSSAPNAQTIAVSASPFSYTATAQGSVFITGGKGVIVSLVRQGGTVANNIVVGGFGVAAGSVPVGLGDVVIVKYAVAPTMVLAPA